MTKPNPFFDISMEKTCKQYMFLSLSIWMSYLEKHPEMLPANIIGSANDIMIILDSDIDDIDIQELAILYESFINAFKGNTEALEKLYKVPILFLVPEIDQ